MEHSFKKRLSWAVRAVLENSNHTKTSLADEIGIARGTLYRWIDEKADTIEVDIVTLASILRVRPEWLQHGEGEMSDNPKLQMIESRVNEIGKDYEGPDRILSGALSKAKNLKQGLEGLIEDLEKLQ